MSLALIVSIGLVGLLVSYLFFKTGTEVYDKHFLLRLLLLGVLFGVFVLLGKAGLDSTQTCDLVLNGSFENHSATPNVTTTFSYDTVCYDNTQSTTGFTFYKLTLWIVRLLSAYILIYIFYEVFIWLSGVISGRRGRSK